MLLNIWCAAELSKIINNQIIYNKFLYNLRQRITKLDKTENVASNLKNDQNYKHITVYDPINRKTKKYPEIIFHGKNHPFSQYSRAFIVSSPSKLTTGAF